MSHHFHISPLFALNAVGCNQSLMSVAEARRTAKDLIEAAGYLDAYQQVKAYFIDQYRRRLQRLASEFNRSTVQAAPVKTVAEDPQQTDPNSRTHYCCNKNVKIVTEPRDNYAHIEASPGGIGCTPPGLRELAAKLVEVADSLDRPSTSNATLITKPAKSVTEVVHVPDSVKFYEAHKKDMAGHGRRGFGTQQPAREIEVRPSGWMVIDLNGPTLEYIGPSLDQAMGILNELDLPPQCLLASMPEVAKHFNANS